MQSRIAVVGVSALFPGSRDAESFWSNIVAGKDMMTEVPSTHWHVDDYYDADPQALDKTYSRRGAFLPQIQFDALAFGIPPSSLPAIDTVQLLGLVAAQAVLADAAQAGTLKVERERIGVILGVTSGTELLGHMAGRLQRPIWQKGLRDLGLDEDVVHRACNSIAAQFVPWQENTFPGLLGNVVAGRISNRLNLGGTNCVVDAACASSLSAISMAINELTLGQADLVITGGVDAANDPTTYMCFSKTPALSRTGDCRPFSNDADGTMVGEGMAMFALRRLEDAERDGDAIYGVLAGLGSSSDGRSKSVYAPSSAGQAKALRRTYAQAGYGPETVELLEAHGTGTKAGDTAEFKALREVFSDAAVQRRQGTRCALGSVKSQIGHTKAAAGAAGLFKALMALHHRVLPPTIKVNKPNPDLEIERSPFYLNTEARPWISNGLHPRRASLSAFGFGGSNFHATLEEYRGPAPRPKRFRSHPAELLLFSGSSCADVMERCRIARDAVLEGASLERLARSSRRTFRSDAIARLVLVATDECSLPAMLDRALERLRTQPERCDDASGMFFQQGPKMDRIAFLFPGQGSQYVGMGAGLANEFERFRAIWDSANQANFGTIDAADSLASLVFPQPVFSDDEREAQEERLRATERAQPAIALTSVAYLELLLTLGVAPAAVAGHSFGELTALHAAGVLDGPDFLHLACERGKLMAAAAGGSGGDPGTMTAVAASVQQVEDYIRLSRSAATVANINAPRQTVASGSSRDMAALESVLHANGVSFRRLPVAAAFHSPIVAGASEAFRRRLDQVRFHHSPIAVFSNVEAQPYDNADPDRSRACLASQIARPVRFAEQIQAMYESGVQLFLEVGPSSVLSELTRKCLADKPHLAFSMDRKGDDGVVVFWHAVARLAVAGVPMHLDALFESFRPRTEADVSKTGVVVTLCGSNYGRPYPPSSSVPSTYAPALTPSHHAPDKIQAPDDALTAPLPPPAITSLAPVASISPSSPDLEETMNKDISRLAASPDHGQPSWLPLLLDLQRQTADAHVQFQRAMTEGHTAFLRTVESLCARLASPSMPSFLHSEEPVEAARPAQFSGTQISPEPMETSAKAKPEMPAPTPSVPRLTISAAPPATPRQPAADMSARFFPQDASSQPSAQTMKPPPGRIPSQPTDRFAHDNGALRPVSAPATANTEARTDLQAKLFAVVADKTGYPIEVLDPNMDMEADLGIDSIKRVEILSSFGEAAPGLLEIAAADVAGLRTLGEILDRIGSAVTDRRSL